MTMEIRKKPRTAKDFWQEQAPPRPGRVLPTPEDPALSPCLPTGPGPTLTRSTPNALSVFFETDLWVVTTPNFFAQNTAGIRCP
jgi:hypothetical protein